MRDDLTLMAEWAAPILARFTPAETRAAMRDIALELRRSQAKRIGRQRDPDGSAYQPRKKLRDRKGRLRGAMFKRLRTARYLRVESSPTQATVVFAGRVQRIARVHQDGLVDVVDRRAPSSASVRYARRRLLGLTGADRDMIIDRLLRLA
ncbi:phage virion morphogenesis protein [Pigmentiphaga sp. CHJ604]|uniref:phage virion morphogenesis protein n=1 Tax=Pigmentiphaga sp. CHJ604 TaxID=3081984 RepID=UPI0030D5E35C